MTNCCTTMRNAGYFKARQWGMHRQSGVVCPVIAMWLQKVANCCHGQQKKRTKIMLPYMGKGSKGRNASVYVH